MHVLTYKVVHVHHHIITRVSLLLYFGYQDGNMTLGVRGGQNGQISLLTKIFSNVPLFMK